MIWTLAAGGLDPAAMTALLLSLAVLLGLARLLGEVATRFRQPAVLGEILAGILLGPTFFAAISPEAYAWLFPAEGPVRIGLDAFVVVSVCLLMVVAGLEVDLSSVWRQGKVAAFVSTTGVLIPFVLGAGLALLMPRALGMDPSAAPVPFALFVGIAMSITALPVIARILIDLNMLKSDLGMLIMSAAMVNDLGGWMGFALLLATIHGQGGDGLIVTLVGTLLFVGLALTAGRWLAHRSLPYIQAHSSWPGGVLGFVLTIALLASAFTEWLGIHAIFGAFIAGVAIGDSRHLRERTRETIHQFITNIFAPLFFASIGLRVNFVASFDLPLVLIVLVIAVVGKVVGCYLGAVWAGLSRKESWAVGFGMSARGAMEIILAQLALDAGLVTERLFVAIVVMALVTSLIAGPMMQKLLQRPIQRSLAELLSEKQILLNLQATTVRQAIAELAARAGTLLANLDVERIDREVWQREQIMSTGIGRGLAVPHARLPEIKKSTIVVGRSERGIDFDATDGKPARLIFLLLTPQDDQTSQIEMLRLIAVTFDSAETHQRALEAQSATEFLAALRVGHGESPHQV